MAERFAITRKLEIDAGHRIPDHESKCFNIHGHRYELQATCSGKLNKGGAESGMVFDFGFLKEEMVNVIDYNFDHKLILCIDDPIVETLCPSVTPEMRDVLKNNTGPIVSVASKCGFITLIRDIPTAENLARLWFKMLEGPVAKRSKRNAKLERLRVYETPNCWSDYPPPIFSVPVYTGDLKFGAGREGPR